MNDRGERILADSREHAEKQGYRLNPDKRILNAVISAIARNESEKGKKYCPCRVVTGKEEEDRKIICPCFYHKEEVQRDGHCKCRLFLKK